MEHNIVKPNIGVRKLCTSQISLIQIGHLLIPNRLRTATKNNLRIHHISNARYKSHSMMGVLVLFVKLEKLFHLMRVNAQSVARQQSLA